MQLLWVGMLWLFRILLQCEFDIQLFMIDLNYTDFLSVQRQLLEVDILFPNLGFGLKFTGHECCPKLSIAPALRCQRVLDPVAYYLRQFYVV